MSTDTTTSMDGRRPLLAAVAFTALSPLLTVPWPGTSSLTASFVVIMASAAAWAWYLRDRLAALLRSRRAVVGAVAAGMACLLVSAVLSADPGSALTFGAENGYMSLASWAALALAFLGAASVPLSRRVQTYLASAVVPAVAVAALTSVQTAAFGRASDAADYWTVVALMLAPAALVQAQASRSAVVRAAWLASVVVTVVSAVASGTATAVFALWIECLALLVLAPRLLSMSPRVGRLAAASLVGVVLVGVSAAVWMPALLPGWLREWTGDALHGPTTLTRLDMWRAGWEVFRTHPLSGVGPDGLLLAGQRYLGEDLIRLEGARYSGVNVFVRDPHLLPLFVLVTGGLLGVVAASVLSVTWVGALRDASRTWPRLATVRLAYATGAIGFVASLAVGPWSVRFVALPALLAGLALAPGPAPKEGNAEAGRPPETVAPRRHFIAGLAVAIPMALAACALVGDVLFTSASVLRDPAGAHARLRVAGLVQPTRPRLTFESLERRGELLVSGGLSFPEYRRVVERAPSGVRSNGAYLVVLGRLALDHAQMTGDRSAQRWGAETVERAAMLSPLHPDVLAEEVRLALDAGNLATAGAALDRCEALAVRTRRLALYEYRFRSAMGHVGRAGRLRSQIRVMAPDLLPLIEATP